MVGSISAGGSSAGAGSLFWTESVFVFVAVSIGGAGGAVPHEYQMLIQRSKVR